MPQWSLHGSTSEVASVPTRQPSGSSLVARIHRYWSQYQPREKADFVVTGHNKALTPLPPL